MNIIMDHKSLIGKSNPLYRFDDLREAALNEFSQKSFESASLNSIINEANMSKGSLYHHFGDKFGLYLALLDLVLERKSEVNAKAASELQNYDDLFKALQLLISSNIGLLINEKRIASLYSRFLYEDMAFRQRVVTLLPPQPTVSLNAICEKSILNGQVDTRYTPAFIQGVLNALLSNFEQLLPLDYTIEDISFTIECLQQLLQQGLASTRGKDEQ